MKAIFIVYDQARGEEVAEMLERLGQRCFTRWTDIAGRGSADGIPHFGNHAWPAMIDAILTFVEDGLAAPVLDEIRRMSAETRDLGLRAFVWDVCDAF